jgi:putative radical SAM enzyme (TIGR03279 family)
MPKIIKSQDTRIPKGALVLSINCQKIEDLLEFKFYNDLTQTRCLQINMDGINKEIVFKPNEKIAIELEEPKYKQCENKCNFCFVNGLPKGLRKELYFRDDDYRLSFLHGNFLSLTNITEDDVARIGRLRLSPLYVSVHTTNPIQRQRLFKNSKAGLIMEHLSSLADKGIKLHCQIVLIPGITDGTHLARTIMDLSTLHPAVCSIGVVPVGMTKFIKNISCVSKTCARDTISLVNDFHKRYRKEFKRGLVYCADEFYIKAGWSIPNTKYYDDFPQYENGVGMVRKFLDEIEELDDKINIKKRFLILTGTLAFPFLSLLKKKLIDLDCIAHDGVDILQVKNTFFGDSVSVSGLIGADDFVQTIDEKGKNYDCIVLPPNCVNDSGEFIDNKTINDDRIMVSPNSIKELCKCLQ